MDPTSNNNEALSLKHQGDALQREGNWQLALEKYEAAIILQPDYTSVWFNKGLMQNKLGKSEEAKASFEQVIRLEPSHLKARYNLATCLSELGDNRAAVTLLRQLKANSPSNTAIHKKLFEHQSKYFAAVGYLIIDLKLTQAGQVKILEFGNGFQSGLMGLQAIMPQLDASKSSISQYVSQHTNYVELSVPGTRTIDESKFTELSQHTAAIDFDYTQLAAFYAVVGSCEYQHLPDDIVKVNHPHLDYVCDNKIATHLAFEQNDAAKIRPKSVVISLSLSVNAMLQKINAKLPTHANFIILKNPCLERGQGVIIVEKKKVRDYLEVLKIQDDTSRIKKFMRNGLFAELKQINLFLGSEPTEILVEEYISSKPIVHQQQLYDPTMRVVCLFMRDANQVICHPLHAYWKLPPKPITEKGNLRSKTISSYSEAHLLAKPVDTTDTARVFTTLTECMPPIFDSILTTDLASELLSLPEENPQQKAYKYEKLLRYANCLTLNAEFTLAKHYLELAKKILPSHFRAFHELGLLYQKQNQQQAAIEQFTTEITMEPTFAAAYLRRAKSYFLDGQIAAGNRDCQLCLQHGYEPKEHALMLQAQYAPITAGAAGAVSGLGHNQHTFHRSITTTTRPPSPASHSNNHLSKSAAVS